MLFLLESLLIAGAAVLLAWALVCWRLAPRVIWVQAPDPYAADVAEFRRQLHDWDRP